MIKSIIKRIWIILAVGQCAALVYVTHRSSNRPFGMVNMAQAYFMGCMLNAEASIQGKDRCVDAAAEFGAQLGHNLDLTPE